MDLTPGSGKLLEENMVTYSSILAGKIPWTEEPGRLWSMGCKESDITEATEHTHKYFSIYKKKSIITYQ